MAHGTETHESGTNFELVGGAVCLDFVNTGSARREGPFKERLHSYDDLVSWAEQAGVLGASDAVELRGLAAADPAAANAVLHRARELREGMYRVFSGLAGGAQPAAADLELLSREQAEAARHRQLAAVGGHVVFDWLRDSPRLDRPLWSVAQSAADLLTADQCTRVKECGTDNCNWLFLDASKNRSRRWCEMKECGNRAKARRHYAKRKSGAEEKP